ncbi:MAG TPA: hypothetical protein VNJ07_05605 [Chitinophagales bacterium]|nr:hypothetical protein [Chitinophagales bacterium]
MKLLEASDEVLASLRHFIKQMDETKYRQPIESLSNSTLGQHTRHIIEFFQCLVRQAEGGVINYDKREHNRIMEEFPQLALQSLDRISQNLKNIDCDKPLILETTFSENKDDFSLISTTFHREWCYALEHAIHHMAIIKIGLKLIAPEVRVHENFGVGPATVKYRQRQCAP